MTLDELKESIVETVDRRIQEIFKPKDERSVEEILEPIERHRWTPPPGAPSTLELLRGDRDQ